MRPLLEAGALPSVPAATQGRTPALLAKGWPEVAAAPRKEPRRRQALRGPGQGGAVQCSARPRRPTGTDLRVSTARLSLPGPQGARAMCVLEGGSIYTIGDDFMEKAKEAHYNKNKDRQGGPEELVRAGVRGQADRAHHGYLRHH